MSGVWQQIIAVDARYNAYRAPGADAQFRTQYIRRRTQLLRDKCYSKHGNDDPNLRKQYLKIRHQLLSERYGSKICQSDGGSVKSLGHSSKLNTGESDFGSLSGGPRRGQGIPQTYRKAPMPSSSVLEGVVPTYAAEATRAMVGSNTMGETYAFVGVHHIFDQHRKAVNAVKFANNDRSRLACCSQDGTLSICQVIPSPGTVVCVFQGHSAPVTDLAWSNVNDLIVSSSKDCTVRVWSVPRGACLRAVPDPVSAPVFSLAFHPLNNNILVTGNLRGLIQVLNVSTGHFYKGGSMKTPGAVMAISFEAVGGLFWAGDNKGYIHSYSCDPQTGKLLKKSRIQVSEGAPITCLSYRAWVTREAHDPFLLVNAANNSLCLFSVKDRSGTLQLRRHFPTKHRTEMIRSTFCPIMSFRQGACVVSGSEDMCVYFFDVTKDHKPCVNKLQGHSAPVLGVGFNYDESLLASCDAQGLVIIWNREQK